MKSEEWSYRPLRERVFECRAPIFTLREGERVRIFTSSTAERSPFPYEGKDLTPLKLGRACPVERVLGRVRQLSSTAATLRSPGIRSQAPIMLSGLWSLVSIYKTRPIGEVTPILDRAKAFPS